MNAVASARSAIRYYLRLKSSAPSPTDFRIVGMFIKGLSCKFKKITFKAYPISYDDLSELFREVLGSSFLEELSFVKLRFITFLVTLYSSLGRYEEGSNLKHQNVVREDFALLLYFKKGKSYQVGESHLGVVSNLPGLDINPSAIFPCGKQFHLPGWHGARRT